MGVRIQAKIDEERPALKAHRGDYRCVGGQTGGKQSADALAAPRG